MFWTNFLLIACFVFVASASTCEEAVARRCSAGAKVRSNFDSEEACTDAALKRCDIASKAPRSETPTFEEYPLAASMDPRQIPEDCRASAGYCDTVQFSIITDEFQGELSWQIIGPIGDPQADIIEGGRQKFFSRPAPALFSEIINGVIMRVPSSFTEDDNSDTDSVGELTDTDNSDGVYVMTEGEYWLTILDSFGDAGPFFQLSVGGVTIFQDVGNFPLDTEFDIDWDHSVSKSFICEDRIALAPKGKCSEVAFSVETTSGNPLNSGWIIEGPLGIIQFDSYIGGEESTLFMEIAGGVLGAHGGGASLIPGEYKITVIDRSGNGAASPRLFFADQLPIQNWDFLRSYTRSITASFICF